MNVAKIEEKGCDFNTQSDKFFAQNATRVIVIATQYISVQLGMYHLVQTNAHLVYFYKPGIGLLLYNSNFVVNFEPHKTHKKEIVKKFLCEPIKAARFLFTKKNYFLCALCGIILIYSTTKVYLCNKK